MPSVPVEAVRVHRPPAETWIRPGAAGRRSAARLCWIRRCFIVSTGGDLPVCGISAVLYAAFSRAVLYFAVALNA